MVGIHQVSMPLSTLLQWTTCKVGCSCRRTAQHLPQHEKQCQASPLGDAISHVGHFPVESPVNALMSGPSNDIVSLLLGHVKALPRSVKVQWMPVDGSHCQAATLCSSGFTLKTQMPSDFLSNLKSGPVPQGNGPTLSIQFTISNLQSL